MSGLSGAAARPPGGAVGPRTRRAGPGEGRPRPGSGAGARGTVLPPPPPRVPSPAWWLQKAAGGWWVGGQGTRLAAPRQPWGGLTAALPG